MQQVDGLSPSKYLYAIASDTVDGKLPFDAAGRALRAYYRERESSEQAIDEGERGADPEHFAQFITHIWQVHPFKEGNTRTVAAFAALSTYRNAQAKIMPSLQYLIRLPENMLLSAHHELDPRDPICTTFFENPSLLRNMPASEALEK